jgi:IS605 OrfB family transposase
MFKTARFKVHNPSRHKSTMLWYAMTRYHETLKYVLEKTLAIPDLLEQVSELDKKEKLRPNKYTLAKLVRTVVPKNTGLASTVRDYLIGDASAMLMSHLSKAYKGVNESNPPTVSNLAAMTDEEFRRAYRDFTDPEAKLIVKPQHQKKIDEAKARGESRIAERLSKIYANWAVSRAAGQVLRKLEGTLPHPIEFTHTELKRGCLFAFCDGKYYALIRLFADKHRYQQKNLLKDGFIDCKTKEPLGGKKYTGLILPLELGREFHEREYLTQGSIQSAKLIVKRREKPTSGAKAHSFNGHFAAVRVKTLTYQSCPDTKQTASFNAEDYDFYIHAAFEFQPTQVETETFLGIDRGAAKIGAATLIDRQGKPLETNLDLEGSAFAIEMRRYEEQIKRLQQIGKQRSRKFSLRGKRADIILGEYANRIVAIAKQYRSQIVIEAIKGVTMGRFLKQSQFTKLKQMLTYKAEREGLPAPVEVPAAYTSQTCARCGHKDAANRPKKDAAGKAIQDVFFCVACGHKANADSNASLIIALRGLHQLENGGKFKKFDLFQQWLKELIGRDGSTAPGQGNQ